MGAAQRSRLPLSYLQNPSVERESSVEPFVQLEHRWAGFNGACPDHMVACSSGTAALHLALESLWLPQGSGVAVPDYTMIACPRAVTLAGHEPVFVGCGEDLLMDLDALDDALSYHTPHVIMVVHVYGRVVPMDEVHALSRKYGAVVVEDLAEAHGVLPHPRTYAACWSFYKNKVVHGEEGGAVWFRDRERAERARELRCLGFTANHDFYHAPRGHNYRLANLLATPILTSIEKYPENLSTRRMLEQEYDALCPKDYLLPPSNSASGSRIVPWVYDLRIKGMSAHTQRKLVNILNREGIAARHGFKPMRDQIEYKHHPYAGSVEDWSRKLSSEVIYLPLTPGVVTPETAGRAFDVIRAVIGR